MNSIYSLINWKLSFNCARTKIIWQIYSINLSLCNETSTFFGPHWLPLYWPTQLKQSVKILCVYHTDLIRSVRTVVLSITALASRHAAPSNTNILVLTTWRRPSCIETQKIFQSKNPLKSMLSIIRHVNLHVLGQYVPWKLLYRTRDSLLWNGIVWNELSSRLGQ